MASESPSISPSESPSVSPSISPSVSPSLSPSESPSISPSISPSQSPSASLSPSISPSVSPSASISPSISPSVSPSASISPSISPSPSQAHWATASLGGFDLPCFVEVLIEPIWEAIDNLSITGINSRKILHRKYKYTINFTHINVSDYNELEALVNNLEPLVFIYDKFPQSESPGVSVLAELSTREIKFYKGATDYYSGTTLTLMEVSAR